MLTLLRIVHGPVVPAMPLSPKIYHVRTFEIVHQAREVWSIGIESLVRNRRHKREDLAVKLSGVQLAEAGEQ